MQNYKVDDLLYHTIQDKAKDNVGHARLCQIVLI